MVKPVHPATVHFPIAFLSLSFALDIIHELSPRLPKNLASKLPISTDLTRLSYFLLSAGLITLLPALVTGVREAVVLISKQGIKEADGTVRPKVKALIAHAVFNDIVAAVSAYVWYQKRSNAANTVAGKLGVGSLATGAAAYAPERWMVVAEAPILALLFMAANIGGVLAYNFGIGFSAGGAGAKKKQ
ncbi:hypothetical protein BDY17DRAFT_301060 [Neohortaea acidophila]|uniref:DUF2231 domain-containing protein n=1 Tax=Neohortaea acidophila TaxID=245834 RepID=A0A6A6PNU7_9PEZI|nr:uncharacterized protein BDY17DRAFT_301060 [Neohortaea acidophila]KAF2481304.1 hypothetical protein BDY17DRAFT_301060 [Neohortaea acidophila]